jgi:chorismate mutase/prephenate dehydratase
MELQDLRRQIDELDSQLLQLLRRRAGLVQAIARCKQASGQAAFDAAREEVILRQASAQDVSPLSPAAVRAIFTEIISACRALEAPVRVAYLGPAWTFSHLAALHRFGQQADYVDCASVHDVFEAVERGQASVGVVPVENSLAGAVPETLDCFLTSKLRILGEHYERIEHCLLGRGPLEQVRRLYAQPHAQAQCRRWLREHLAGVEVIPQPSTAASAQAAAGEPGSAALAPAEAAEHYGLQILARGIEDAPNNRTRFFLIGQGHTAATGRDKTSLLFATQHRAGALHEALTPFREHGVNMTMIQSRPVPGRLWEYVFFVDIEGHAADPHIQQALEELRQRAAHLAVLGSYPVAE